METECLFEIKNPNNIPALPVSYLIGNLHESFLNSDDGFKEMYLNEIKHNGLKEKIHYYLLDEKIHEVATINQDKQISLYENYNQYLWCISYALLTVYVEGYELPRKQNRYNGRFGDNHYVNLGYKVLSIGLSLLKEYQCKPFYQIPNPQTVDEKEYLVKTNGIYCLAMRYIILHEFAHHFHGHTNQQSNATQAINNELVADEYAFKQIAKYFEGPQGRSQKFGAIAAIISLLFIKKQLGKIENQPDLPGRLFALISQLELQPDDDLWGIASFGIKLWAVYVDRVLYENQNYDSHQELFEHLHSQL